MENVIILLAEPLFIALFFTKALSSVRSLNCFT